jgi:hypothetical protein
MSKVVKDQTMKHAWQMNDNSDCSNQIGETMTIKFRHIQNEM